MAQNDATAQRETPSDEVLPSYSTPPVIEVVCGVQFEPLTKFTSVHYGEFRELIRHEYPGTEDQTPVAELFENRPAAAGGTETLPMPPLRRVFYIDNSGNFLLQLQPSRFLANWRRMRDEDQYPRFDATFTRFLEGWDVFLRFARDSGLGMPTANQYELTYINHIVAREEGFPAEIEGVMPMFSWSRGRSLEFLPTPASVSMRVRFALPEEKGAVHLKVDHGRRKRDQQETLVLDFTARGPAAPNWSDLRPWFTMAHQHIVNGFTDLTSPTAHEHWGRTE